MHLSVTVMHIHYCEAKNSLIQFQLTDFLLLFHFWLKDILKALFKLTNRLFAPLRQWVVTSNNKPTRCWALSLSPTAVSKSINITKIKPTFQQIQLQLRHVLLTGEFLFSKINLHSRLTSAITMLPQTDCLLHLPDVATVMEWCCVFRGSLWKQVEVGLVFPFNYAAQSHQTQWHHKHFSSWGETTVKVIFFYFFAVGNIVLSFAKICY